MNAGATAERVHEALRWRIMNREFRPGDRLDPALLAAPLASSVTPVRDALHLLTGEGLVETRPGSGFHVPALDEPGLKDLYAWSAELLVLAMRSWSPKRGSCPAAELRNEAGPAAGTAELFALIARRSTNSEHARAVERLNARLHAVRCAEPHVLDHTETELAALSSAVQAAERADLQRQIASYHRRRSRAAAEIVRAVHRAG